MDVPRIPADPKMMDRWKELALSIRATEWAMRQIPKPDPGTTFHAVDHMYPTEAISQWCREGIRSALDHLSVWADKTVPLVQYEGQVVVHNGFRWPFTLMRAGIEGAALSLWLSGSSDSGEALARLLRMVRHDLSEQEKAWKALGRSTEAITRRRATHDSVAKSLAVFGKDTPALPSMVSLVRAAAQYAGREADLFEGHWRTCSAAAHGKDWAIMELQTVSGEMAEWMPGQFHFAGVIDAEKLTDMLSDTVALVSVAEVRYLQHSYKGDLAKLLQRSAYEAAKLTPQKDDGAQLRRIAEALGIADE